MTEVLLNVLGIALFVVGIGFSIGWHELGHLVPAKAFGVKVTQYMVGFGPTAWSRRRGETEYGFKWVPAGGYIRMIGMFPPEPGSDGTTLRASSTGRFSTLVSDARRQSLEEVTPADADRVFYKLPVRKKVVVMLGGPVMNLVLACGLFFVVLCLIGIPTTTTTVGAVAPCTPTLKTIAAGTDKDADCPGSTASPASVAGLAPGDVITAVGGTAVTTWDQQRAAIRALPAGPSTLTVDRAGTTLTFPVTLTQTTTPTYDDAGKVTGSEQRTFLGIVPALERQQQPVSAVPSYVWNITTRSVQALVTLPARFVDLVRQEVTHDQPRDPNGLVGVVGISRIAGEAVALQSTPVLDKLSFFLGLLAGLNLFLFLFNLIPLLPLDGGHVAGALWEGTKRGWARLRHRPDPGYVDVAKGLPIAYGVSIVLIAMSVVILYADLVDPIRLGS